MVYETKKDRCRSRLPQFPRTGFYQRAKRDLNNTRNPFNWLPFPLTQIIHHQFLFYFFSNKKTSHYYDTLTLPLSRLNTAVNHSATGLCQLKHPIATSYQPLARAAKQPIAIVSNQALTQHSLLPLLNPPTTNHPVLGCEPVIYCLSAFTATLFFNLVILSDP